MPSNHSALFARRALMALLKGEATVTVLVPAGQIYPGERPPNPPRPFLAWGVADTTPLEATGLAGENILVRLHAYTETTGAGDDTVPGEDMAHEIVRVVVALLGGDEGADIDLAGTGCPFPATAHVHCSGTQVIADRNDGSAWHAIISLAITVSS